MALRKRSYTRDSDKWLGVAWHNSRVKAQKNRKVQEQRDKRLASIETKLRGEGIDGSWASETMRIMEHHGFGLNQFTTRVLPHLERRMEERALEEARATLAKAQELAEIEKRTAEAEEVKRLGRVAERKRKEVREAAISARANARVAPGEQGEIDRLDIAKRATSVTIGEIAAELDQIVVVVRNPSSSLNSVRAVVNQSIFFDHGRNSIWAGLLLTMVRAAVGLFIVVFVLRAADGSAYEEAVGVVVFVGLLALPFDLIWSFVGFRRPRIKLALSVGSDRLSSAYYSEARDGRVNAPKLRKSTVPGDIWAKLEEANSSIRRFKR